MTSDSQPNLARETVRGTFWTYASYYSGKLMIFLSTIILARLLTKDDFGVVGYALVTISFLDVLNNLGVGPALIYHREDPKAADTGFWLGLAVSGGLLGLAWLVAPLAGWYFGDPRAIPVIRVLSLTFPLSAFSNIHDSLLRKGLAFKNKFIPDFARAVGKGLFSILFALLGFGAWSLIFGQLIGVAVTVVAYWKVLPWRPSLRFVSSLARSLLRYGISIVALNSLAMLLLNLDYLFIGRFMGAEALGVYTLAFRLPDLSITQFCRVISTVVFPVYVKMRDDPSALRKGFLITLRYVSVVTIPLGVGLALVAEPFVITILTDKWLEAIPVMQAIAIYAVLFSLSYNAGSLYKAEGRPSVLTQLALVRLALLLPALYWAATRIGTIASVGWMHALVALLAGTLNLVVASKMIKTPFLAVLDTIRPAVVSAAVMSLAVLVVLNLAANLPPVLQLILGSLTGVMVYGGTLYWQQSDLFFQARQTLQATMGQK